MGYKIVFYCNDAYVGIIWSKTKIKLRTKAISEFEIKNEVVARIL